MSRSTLFSRSNAAVLGKLGVGGAVICALLYGATASSQTAVPAASNVPPANTLIWATPQYLFSGHIGPDAVVNGNGVEMVYDVYDRNTQQNVARVSGPATVLYYGSGARWTGLFPPKPESLPAAVRAEMERLELRVDIGQDRAIRATHACWIVLTPHFTQQCLRALGSLTGPAAERFIMAAHTVRKPLNDSQADAALTSAIEATRQSQQAYRDTVMNIIDNMVPRCRISDPSCR